MVFSNSASIYASNTKSISAATLIRTVFLIRREKARSKLERQQRKAKKLRLELELEKAERKVQEATSESKLKRENGDEGDDKPLRSTANNGTDLSLPTPLNFLRRISKADNYDIQTCTLGN
ncbi:hypothetical protein NA56DRAFT_699294 [Hyaloscypha hepaticicola]|uniref:Uncharacterized protein n=1 Tax=Hyaloscypha hepaticicola TaxID=2082293 RepID=A0A2J6QGH2_9HELO|nr:hypothetical protein NA56DRAFT_699294 [Hyaloscypha hepaticicola]